MPAYILVASENVEIFTKRIVSSVLEIMTLEGSGRWWWVEVWLGQQIFRKSDVQPRPVFRLPLTR
jgi:hypothetical protein